MKVLSPQARRNTTQVSTVARPKTLDGLRIGLLDNTKAPVDKMLVHLDKRLHERIPGVQTVHYAKREMGIPAPEALLAQLQQVDVVINALGD